MNTPSAMCTRGRSGGWSRSAVATAPSNRARRARRSATTWLPPPSGRPSAASSCSAARPDAPSRRTARTSCRLNGETTAFAPALAATSLVANRTEAAAMPSSVHDLSETPTNSTGRFRVADAATRPGRRASGVDERAEHVPQDPAVAVVVGLAGGVDPDDRIEGDHRAVATHGPHRDGRRRRAVVECGQSGDRHGLGPVEPERSGGLDDRELQGQHPHADQVRAVDAFEALGEHRADAQQTGALRGPVAAGPGAVLLAGQDDERYAGGRVPLVILAGKEYGLSL